MESKMKRVRRTFANQLVKKHRLKLIIPNSDINELTFQQFINEMIEQLHEKLSIQDEILFKDGQDQVANLPLAIQRKQLQKDLEDFDLLEKGGDQYRIQKIIERIEHIDMFNSKKDFSPIKISSSFNNGFENSLTNQKIEKASDECTYRNLCQEFLNNLHWPSELFAPEYDRCFCRNCYSLELPNIYQSNFGNEYPLIIPRNWVKFGLRVDEVHAKIHRVWSEWMISYHGTLPNAALSMVKHRQICLPGDKLLDGSQLTIRPGHIPGSPTIRYAAQHHYASPILFTSQIDKHQYSAKIVLRCRQMPGSFLVQGETLNNSQKMRMDEDFCDFIPNERVEWKTEQRGTVIFDGLCVHLKRRIDQQDSNRIFQTPFKQIYQYR